MPEPIEIDVRLQESTDDGPNTFRVEINVRVSDSEGTPLPSATISVTGLGGSDYARSKPAKDHGISQTFELVPLPASVEISASGYESENIELSEDDAGTTIKRGY
jgi:hypothetical protein